jgi:hypothetical protein
MAALASLTDLELVAGFTPDAARATRLLEMASAAVRRYTGRSFEYVADDEVVVRTNADCRLRLPNGPVSALTAINGPVGDDATDLEDVDLLTVDALGFVSGTFTCGGYTVTYTHGYDPIPDDVIDVVCQIAAHRLAGPSSGLASESLGDWSASYRDTAEVDILRPLDPYRVNVGRIVVL